jgi:3-phenylpropionate/trans-cinnamate dioxygenase ferredoxin reductase subunit
MPGTDFGVLIVGAGPAGTACAETLRAEGYDGSILLAGREPEAPYERPPLSKEYLSGKLGRDDFALTVPGDVELRTRTSVMKLDPAAKTAKLASGEEIAFGQALVATGANVRRLRVDGAQLEGIHYLRALGNADAIRTDAESASRVVLIGGSYIACEVAATLTAAGKRCTMVMLEDQPLSTGFGDDVGRFFAGVLRDKGVELVTGDPLGAFEGSERVERVVTEGGRVLDADLVVMGTGAVPDVMLARAAGLALSEARGGVACDSRLRTSADGIWAAGDICAYDSVLHGREVRIEHWELARAQGAHAARAMLGAGEPFAEVPYFWSDLADWASLEYVGAASTWDTEVLRGSYSDGRFAVLYLDGGRLAGALSVGRSGDLDGARRLIASRADLTGREGELANPATDLSAI